MGMAPTPIGLCVYTGTAMPARWCIRGAPRHAVAGAGKGMKKCSGRYPLLDVGYQRGREALLRSALPQGAIDRDIAGTAQAYSCTAKREKNPPLASLRTQICLAGAHQGPGWPSLAPICYSSNFGLGGG